MKKAGLIELKDLKILNKVTVVLFIFLLSNTGCRDSSEGLRFGRKYCYVDSLNDLTILFRNKHDTIYFYYLNIVEHGKYINGYSDSLDYAGKFSQYENFPLYFDIKNYRNPEIIYNLRLSPYQDSLILWKIENDQMLSYLPEKVLFRECE